MFLHDDIRECSVDKMKLCWDGKDKELIFSYIDRYAC